MTQRDVNSAVALATGETLGEVRHRGFSLADPVRVCFDPEPSDLPQTVDWDDIYPIEKPRFTRRRRLAAAR
jgi:hypothetical protein